MKHRRLCMILMTICLCVGLFTVTASAAAGTSGDVKWVLSGGTLTISGSGDMDDYDYVNTVAPWHEYYESITKIVIKNGVEEIGDFAFADMVYVTDVSIAGSVNEIGMGAFYNCQSLESVKIPDSVTVIDDYAFECCYSMKEADISRYVTSLGDGVFSMCISLEEVDVSTSNSKYRDIGGVVYNKAKTKLMCVPGAYEGEFEIPDSVTAIANSAFSGCMKLTGVTIPTSVTRIGDTAFYYCTALTRITIPNSVTNLGDSAFFSCVELTKVTLSDKLTSIPNMAFYYCIKLDNVTIPDAVKRIGDYAFAGCEVLKTIKLPAKVTKLGTGVFYECKALKTVTIPNSVTSIGEALFYNCPNLETVTMSSNIKDLPAYTFYFCKHLKNIKNYGSFDSIGAFCFVACEDLKNVSLSKRVTKIPESAFASCTSLTNFVIPESVTSIESSAFGSCYSLKKVTIPKNVRTIGEAAFGYIEENSLELTFLGDAPQMSQNTFMCSMDVSCYYPSNDTWTDVVTKNYEGTVTWKTVTAPEVTVSNVVKSGKVKLTWNKVDNAVKYNVYRADAQNGKYTLLKSVTGTVFTNTGAENGKVYWYKVEAVAENGLTTAACAPKKAACKLKQPTGLTVTVNGNGKPVLKWNAVDGAVKYQIWRCTTQNGKYGLMKTVTGTTYTNLNAKPGNNYFYKVIAVAAKPAANSAPSVIRKVSLPLAEPRFTISLNENGKPVLTWNAVDGAAKYQIWRCTTQNGKYGLMKTVTGTSYTNLTAKRGQVYYYKIKAVAKNTACNSPCVTAVSIVCPPETPVVSVELNENLKPVLSWNAVDGAARYQIWRCVTENGKYGLMKTVTGTTFTNLNAVEGKTYYYKVVAVGANVNAKAQSALVSVTCVAPVEPENPVVPDENETPIDPDVPGENETPAAPIPLDPPVVTGALVEGVPVLSWESVDGASAYEVYKAVDDGAYVLAATVTEPGYTEPEALPGYAYSYKVVAISADPAESSAPSVPVTVDCPLPENMTPFG